MTLYIIEKCNYKTIPIFHKKICDLVIEEGQALKMNISTVLSEIKVQISA